MDNLISLQAENAFLRNIIERAITLGIEHNPTHEAPVGEGVCDG
jgi:hypothetical protein